MCDYSLHQVASRPARLGEKLVTTKFPNSITRGFASVDDPEVAVCLLPGTELAFDQQVRCETGIVFAWSVGHTVAKFQQINKVGRTFITTPLSSPMEKLFCLRTYAKANARPYCNYQHARAVP